jgi:hypothetical protein
VSVWVDGNVKSPKFDSQVKGWYKSMKLRDDGAKDAGVNEDSIKGLWLEVPDFPKNVEFYYFALEGEGEVRYMRKLELEEGEVELTVERMKNVMYDGSAFTMDKVAKFVAVKRDRKEGDIDVDENPGELTAIFKYPVAAVTYKEGAVKRRYTRMVPDIFIFTDDWVFWVIIAFESPEADQVREKYVSQIEGWYKSMKLRGGGSESKKQSARPRREIERA